MTHPINVWIFFVFYHTQQFLTGRNGTESVELSATILCETKNPNNIVIAYGKNVDLHGETDEILMNMDIIQIYPILLSSLSKGIIEKHGNHTLTNANNLIVISPDLGFDVTRMLSNRMNHVEILRDHIVLQKMC